MNNHPPKLPLRFLRWNDEKLGTVLTIFLWGSRYDHFVYLIYHSQGCFRQSG